MIRRQTRLRREYLYRKSLEGKDRQIFERKQAVKEAIASGKPIPTELKNEGAQFTKDLQYDEAQAAPTTHIDDEYALAGVYDPKVLVTTSRDPSSRLQQFAKEMRLVFPNSQRINRGGHVMKEIVDACKANDVTDLIILHEHRGEPDGMIISHFPHGPTAFFTLNNVVLRHDIKDHGTVSEAFPHLIFNNFTSKLGQRTADILKYLFPVPKEDSKRVMTFSNENDYISFRHHVFVKTSHKDVQLAEVGPRFEMKLFQIKSGTVELTDADTEWVLRPYQNTAKKRTQL
ncbi:snoRNA-binding rRNA-processing protein imp4 [Linnemannia zychae]|nr:snoRNA-binding rRNA-processing protein imp4 [Linnemannia zychae]